MIRITHALVSVVRSFGGAERGVHLVSTPALVRNLILVILSAAVLSSCDAPGTMDLYGPANPHSSVSGSVVMNGDPAVGVEVELQQDAVLAETPTVVESTFTDAQGHFQMNFAHDGNHSYYAVVGGLFSENRVSLRAGSNTGVVIHVK